MMARNSQEVDGAPSGLGSVLVVDDDATNRELLNDLLGAEGHRLLEAADGELGLQVAREKTPDVVLLDVMMPAPDGFEVCRRLKADPRTAGIPVLLVTALSDRRARLQGMKAGADDFLPKPIDTVDTLLRVRNAVRLKQFDDLARARAANLDQAQRLHEELLCAIASDLKVPLEALDGHLSRLESLDGDQLSERQRGLLGKSLACSHRLVEVVALLLSSGPSQQAATSLEGDAAAPEA